MSNPAKPPAAIEARALTRAFDGVLALDGVNLTVPEGMIFGLLGSNGAGKSTLIKILTTLLPPSSGRARVAGHDVVHEAQLVRARTGYVPQLVSADSQLTGRENLLMSARLYGVPRRERARRISDALQFMELGDAADRLVRGYSGGMIRRLEIAQALLHGPEVLFLDEPTVGLDPVARQAKYPSAHDDSTSTVVLLLTDAAQDVSVAVNGLLVAEGEHTKKVVIERVPVGTAEIVMAANGADKAFKLWVAGDHATTVPLGVADAGPGGFIKTVLQGSLQISPSDRDSSTSSRFSEFARLGIAAEQRDATDRAGAGGHVEQHRTAQLSREQRYEPWCSHR